jgi:hypothetical protein
MGKVHKTAFGLAAALALGAASPAAAGTVIQFGINGGQLREPVFMLTTGAGTSCWEKGIPATTFQPNGISAQLETQPLETCPGMAAFSRHQFQTAVGGQPLLGYITITVKVVDGLKTISVDQDFPPGFSFDVSGKLAMKPWEDGELVLTPECGALCPARRTATVAVYNGTSQSQTLGLNLSCATVTQGTARQDVPPRSEATVILDATGPDGSAACNADLSTAAIAFGPSAAATLRFGSVPAQTAFTVTGQAPAGLRLTTDTTSRESDAAVNDVLVNLRLDACPPDGCGAP